MAASEEQARALAVLQALASILNRDAPLVQAMALLSIARAGDGGVDQARLMTELKTSTAGISRTVQALSAVHYMKDREGYGLVERVFDPMDNRRRTLRLTASGRKAVAKVLSAMEGK